MGPGCEKGHPNDSRIRFKTGKIKEMTGHAHTRHPLPPHTLLRAPKRFKDSKFFKTLFYWVKQGFFFLIIQLFGARTGCWPSPLSQGPPARPEEKVSKIQAG